MTIATTTAAKGGSWLIEEADASAVFTREKLSEEHRLIGQTADEFIDHEVSPALEKLEQKDWATARALVARCGELGLLATDVPEAYGGLALDKTASIVVGESVGRCASFATTLGAQVGLTITPLVCFGTEEQKRAYLPRLASGEIFGRDTKVILQLLEITPALQGLEGAHVGGLALTEQLGERVEHQRLVRGE